MSKTEKTAEKDAGKRLVGDLQDWCAMLAEDLEDLCHGVHAAMYRLHELAGIAHDLESRTEEGEPAEALRAVPGEPA